MDRTAVDQLHVCAAGIDGDAMNTEKAPLDVEHLAMNAGAKVAGQQDGGDSHSKADRSIEKQVAGDGRERIGDGEGFDRQEFVRPGKQCSKPDESTGRQPERQRPEKLEIPWLKSRRRFR